MKLWKGIINGLVLEALALLIILALCQGAWASFEDWGNWSYSGGTAGGGTVTPVAQSISDIVGVGGTGNTNAFTVATQQLASSALSGKGGVGGGGTITSLVQVMGITSLLGEGGTGNRNSFTVASQQIVLPALTGKGGTGGQGAISPIAQSIFGITGIGGSGGANTFTAAVVNFPLDGILDTFTGTNGTSPPNSNWTNATNGLQIQSNQATGTTASTLNSAIWNTTFTADHSEFYITIPVLPAEGAVNNVNMYLESAATGHGYVVAWSHISGTDTIKLFKVTSDTFEGQVGSTINQEVAAGDSLGWYNNGSTKQLWYKASGGSWVQLGSNFTDSTYTGVNTVVLEVYGTAIRIDNFGGGNR